MKLVFATNNQHKLEEARAILQGQVEIMSLAELGCYADIPETATTLRGNSALKARYIYEHFGVDCFADDTGLEIHALHGEPGVYSARYASLDADANSMELGMNTDAQNRAKVLRLLNGVTDRSARFCTVITLIMDGTEYVFEGEVKGEIATHESGEGGFGYDSIFVPEGYNQTFAELGAELKNSMSHRGRALKVLWDFLVDRC